MITSAAAEEMTSDQIVSVAEGYLAAYSTFCQGRKRWRSFMSDDMVFIDPTLDQSGCVRRNFFLPRKSGGDERARRLSAAQYKRLSHRLRRVKRCYESNGVVVFIGDLTYTLVSKKDETFTGEARSSPRSP
ncbi:MAG: hypothetical protein R3C58_03610 [Parvularculaceae bacterium]